MDKTCRSLLQTWQEASELVHKMKKTKSSPTAACFLATAYDSSSFRAAFGRTTEWIQQEMGCGLGFAALPPLALSERINPWNSAESQRNLQARRWRSSSQIFCIFRGIVPLMMRSRFLLPYPAACNYFLSFDLVEIVLNSLDMREWFSAIKEQLFLRHIL